VNPAFDNHLFIEAFGCRMVDSMQSDQATAEQCTDRLPLRDIALRTWPEFVKPKIVRVELRTYCDGFQTIQEIELGTAPSV
jgi:hypothetical protein